MAVSLNTGGKLVLLGAGMMGRAMLEGWLKLGLQPADVVALDPYLAPDAADALRSSGVSVNPAPALYDKPSVVLLAIKPQTMNEALAAVAEIFGPDTLAISVMAGRTIAGMEALLPARTAIVRAMPNTPSAVGRGITGAVANRYVTQAHRQIADALLRATGAVEWVENESLIDAVTAVSGSGPAYVYHLVEAMAAAGVAAGLEQGLAMRLARATVTGAGELLHKSDLSAAELRRNVTSPAGTTAAAMEILLAEDGLTPLMTKAVLAARKRAQELAS